MKDIIGQLLGKIKNLSTGSENSDAFNIFKVLGIESKEVLTCRLLGELMNPHGAYGLDEKPLQLFLQKIGALNFAFEEDLKNATFVLEKTIDNDRRFDIVIYIKDFVIPIEVKIWADDQNKQLCDYYQYFEEKNYSKQNFKIYYLTPNGRKPSKFSTCDLKENIDYKCISFEKDISKWIGEILKELNNDTSASVNMILKQFQEVIGDMCAQEKSLEKVKEAVNFQEGQFKPNDSMKALLFILEANQGNKLWESIRKEYLRESLKELDHDYELSDQIDSNENPEGPKGTCIFTIKKGSKEIAWICVETNLYIVAKKIKKDAPNKWKGNEGYYWIYISPEGIGNKFSLKDPNPDISDANKSIQSIDIKNLLEEIEA